MVVVVVVILVVLLLLFVLVAFMVLALFLVILVVAVVIRVWGGSDYKYNGSYDYEDFVFDFNDLWDAANADKN